VAVIRPKATVRRFDVFAEFTRLEKVQEGFAADEAKGYAIWLAKVVAARKFGRLKPGHVKHTGPWDRDLEGKVLRKFRSLGNVEQTDEVFDKDIVERMGKDFYQKVFSPALEDAFRNGKSYKQIRDTIRKVWKV
jgi:hypothetical protein